MENKCGERILHLQNAQGNLLKLRLRRYHEGDEAGMIACVRDEYGDTYFKRGFYDPEYLKKEAAEHITFLVAETEKDGIAGMLILKNFAPEESMCEIASQIFRKKYRGYGLAMPFFEYGMEILLNRDYSAAYCLPVLFHDVTQRLLYRLGLRATGLVLNVFDMENITHSYRNGRNLKHSQGIQIRAVGKRDAGRIYIPQEHQEFCRTVYESLGVKFHMAQTTLRNPEDIPLGSILSCRQDELQSSLEIQIRRIGQDLWKRLSDIHAKYPLVGRQTANVFLNCSDPNAEWAYRMLEGQGYFFTGLKPLCSAEEYLVLHHSGEVEIYLEDYVFSEEFGKLANYIRKQMNA
jgi:hypothetical protein